VRFRANYNPKGLQLDSEGGAVPHTGPVVRSYFGMMARVYRIEVCLFSAKASYHLRSVVVGMARVLQRIEYVT
jgi:hypothetical protein